MEQGQAFEDADFLSSPPTLQSATTFAAILEDPETLARRERVRLVQICIGIFLLIVGTGGNLLAFVVLRQKSMRVHATAFLLSVLAICDMVCLYLGLLNKIVEYFVRYDVFRTEITILCPIQVFLLYGSLQYASWLLVLVAAERFFSVWFPIRSRSVCTVRNAKIAAGIVLLVQAGINCHLLFTTAVVIPAKAEPERIQHVKPVQLGNNSSSAASSVIKDTLLINSNSSTGAIVEASTEPKDRPVCDSKPEYDYFLNNIWPFIDLTIFCFVPFAIMLILNVLIAWRILSLRRHSTTAVAMASSGRRLSGMTAIMFACCFSFFALTLPISVYMVVRSRIQSDEPQNRFMMFVIWTVTNLMQYASNAVNFFLYCLSGTIFRRELIKLFRSWHIVLKSLFCCWYCCPHKVPNAYSDYAEADIAGRFQKRKEGTDRLKLVGVNVVVPPKKPRSGFSILKCISGDDLERMDVGNQNALDKAEDSIYSPVVFDSPRVAEQQPFILRQNSSLPQISSSDKESDTTIRPMATVPNSLSTNTMKHIDSDFELVGSKQQAELKNDDQPSKIIQESEPVGKKASSTLLRSTSSTPTTATTTAKASAISHQLLQLPTATQPVKTRKGFSFRRNKSAYKKAVLSTLYDSEATSGGAYAFAAMKPVFEEAVPTISNNNATINNSNKDGSNSEVGRDLDAVPELGVTITNNNSDQSSALPAQVQTSSPSKNQNVDEYSSYVPAGRSHHPMIITARTNLNNLFDAFGPMC